MDLSKQLEALRQRMARVEQRAPAEDEAPGAGLLFDGYLQSAGTRDPAAGCEVETAAGRHWEMERSWPAQARHGGADIGALSELAADTLAVLSGEDPVETAPQRWAFLDTETTGLAGGSGTLPFLIGVGGITAGGFFVRQFFLREPSEELSQLAALEECLRGYDALVTYNGKAFDVPLLETRYVLNRMKSPFSRLKHVDLLYGARRLWRLKLQSCRLQDLERFVLGYERVGDVGGAFIPNLYFHYLRNRDAAPLEGIFTHNAIDILSLACLTAIVPQAMREPEKLKHGAELAGVARWFQNEAQLGQAARLMRLALARPMEDELVWETLWRLAEVERKRGQNEEALQCWTELSTARNPYQARALERCAMHYERHAKDAERALEATRAALTLEPTPELRKRAARLAARLSRKPERLL